MSDYYELLGVSKNSTQDQIKKAYRKLAVQWHPDKNPDNRDEAEAKFKKISEAYQILSKPEERKKYDMYGKEGLQPGFGQAGAYHFYTDDIDPYELFEEMFGSSFGFFGFKPKTAGIPKTPDTVSALECSLEEIYCGGVKTLKYIRNNCGQPEEIQLDVNIQQGWQEGTKITFESKGDIRYGMKAGNLILILRLIEHDIWDKDDDFNLHATMDLNLQEALEGCNKKIQLLDEEMYSVEIPPLQDSMEEVVVPDKGMPIRRHKKVVGFGDIILNFRIIFYNETI